LHSNEATENANRFINIIRYTYSLLATTRQSGPEEYGGRMMFYLIRKYGDTSCKTLNGIYV